MGGVTFGATNIFFFFFFSLIRVDGFVVILMMFGWCLRRAKVAGCPVCCNWSGMSWEPPDPGRRRDLAGTMSHLLVSLASGILHAYSWEAQSSPACHKTNLVRMKMACLLLSRSHLSGSMSRDIICCVCSLFWACTDGDLHGHHFQSVVCLRADVHHSSAETMLFSSCSLLLKQISWRHCHQDCNSAASPFEWLTLS